MLSTESSPPNGEVASGELLVCFGAQPGPKRGQRFHWKIRGEHEKVCIAVDASPGATGEHRFSWKIQGDRSLARKKVRSRSEVGEPPAALEEATLT